MHVKAVLTDFVGTLTNASFYTMEASMDKLYQALTEAGFQVSHPQFLESYRAAHEKYRAIRYDELKEVTNAIWVSESLCRIGCNVTPEDARVKAALNTFFQDYVNFLELRPYAKKLLEKILATMKLALVSNFTYAPVVYCSLRKLKISQFFNVIVVSHQCGWRKPNLKIFKQTLEKLQVDAAEAIYIGDSPLEDIKGAQQAGLRTIFVASQFYSFKDLTESGIKPDSTATDLKEIYQNFENLTHAR